MSNKLKTVTLRIPESLKMKIEFLADTTNRSFNSMVIEMTEKYYSDGRGEGKFMGLTAQQYRDYLTYEQKGLKHVLFEFDINTTAEVYNHDLSLGIDTACNVDSVSGCYALVEKGEIVYAGSSVDLNARMRARRANGWIASGNNTGGKTYPEMKLSSDAVVYFWFCDDYREAERDLIYAISPKFNKVTPKHSGNSDMAISTNVIRSMLSDREKSPLTPEKEALSLNRLLSMRAYK